MVQAGPGETSIQKRFGDAFFPFTDLNLFMLCSLARGLGVK